MKAIPFKKILSYLPEASMLGVGLYWFIDNLLVSPSYINYPILAVILFVLVLIIWRVKAFAITLSVLLSLGSLYMVLAVISEYREFPSGDPDGKRLLFTGLAIFLSLIVMSAIMPIKYFKKKVE